MNAESIKGVYHRFSTRAWINWGAVLVCGLLIASAWVFEHYFDEYPCSLCLFQRYFVIWTGSFFLLAGLLDLIERVSARMRPFIATGLLVLTALLMVFFNQLEWIPLFVRYLVLFTLIVGTVILFLASTGWVPTKALFRVVASFLLIAAISGMITSARHIWIQGLPPDQVPACAPPLSFMVEIEGLWRAMQQTFLAGTADCHDSTWRFLGLSMPMWVLINFLGLGLIGFARNFFGFEQREAAR